MSLLVLFPSNYVFLEIIVLLDQILQKRSLALYGRTVQATEQVQETHVVQVVVQNVQSEVLEVKKEKNKDYYSRIFVRVI